MLSDIHIYEVRKTLKTPRKQAGTLKSGCDQPTNCVVEAHNGGTRNRVRQGHCVLAAPLFRQLQFPLRVSDSQTRIEATDGE